MQICVSITKLKPKSIFKVHQCKLGKASNYMLHMTGHQGKKSHLDMKEMVD